jgi:hypothetical protein
MSLISGSGIRSKPVAIGRIRKQAIFPSAFGRAPGQAADVVALEQQEDDNARQNRHH